MTEIAVEEHQQSPLELAKEKKRKEQQLLQLVLLKPLTKLRKRSKLQRNQKRRSLQLPREVPVVHLLVELAELEEPGQLAQ